MPLNIKGMWQKHTGPERRKRDTFFDIWDFWNMAPFSLLFLSLSSFVFCSVVPLLSLNGVNENKSTKKKKKKMMMKKTCFSLSSCLCKMIRRQGSKKMSKKIPNPLNKKGGPPWHTQTSFWPAAVTTNEFCLLFSTNRIFPHPYSTKFSITLHVIWTTAACVSCYASFFFVAKREEREREREKKKLTWQVSAC